MGNRLMFSRESKHIPAKLLLKCERIIDSCSTKQQLEVAEKYVMLATKDSLVDRGHVVCKLIRKGNSFAKPPRAE